MRKNNLARRQGGQQLAEMMGGILVLIPIVLFLLDMAVIVMGNQLADKYTKAAARAAANQGTKTNAEKAANDTLATVKKGGFIAEMIVDNINYVPIDPTNPNDVAQGRVSIEVKTTINLPVPVPFIPNASSQVFTTQANEPVVALPPP